MGWWGSVAVVMIGVAGLVSAPHMAEGATGLLFLPGLVALVLAPLTLNIGYGRTVLSEKGLRTSQLFSRHSCRWDEVAVIEARTVHGRRGTRNTWVMVELTSGGSFRQAAPFDSNNGPDSEPMARVMRVQSRWYSQSSGGPISHRSPDCVSWRQVGSIASPTEASGRLQLPRTSVVVGGRVLGRRWPVGGTGRWSRPSSGTRSTRRPVR